MSNKKNKLKTMAQMKSKKKKLKYDVLTDIEHVLQRPDTYGGSVTEETWEINLNGKTEEKTIVPMLFKIFDEAIVNAADNYTRKSGMTYISVTIDQTKGWLYIKNDGKTVPIKLHPKKDVLTGKKIYTPEMVFFRMRSGQNFDDTEVRYEGGRNGIGIKLASIFSKSSTLEICNKGKRYLQIYRDNMRTRNPPGISHWNYTHDTTCVDFKVDLRRFKINDQPLTRIPDDVYDLMKRRIWDVAACCPGIRCTFNGYVIDPPNFYEYYLREDPLFVSEKKNWSVAVQLTDRENDSKDVSFVNNIWTRDNGHHVDHVKEEICKCLMQSQIIKRMGLKKKDIAKQICVVMKCYLANPTFNSQMKERMTLPIKKFDTQFKMTGPLKKQLLSGPLIQRLQEIKDEKDGRKLKKNDGKKVKNLSILKLTDAKKAGTKRSDECTLILTEGDSALALALAGLSVVKNDLFGAYPLKGKILNGEKANKKQWSENAVIQNVIKILGLKHGVKYDSTKDLRYGHILIMSDQDVDGFHIRGLVMSMFSSHWHELLSIPGFIQVMKTPLVKAFNRKRLMKEFFDEEQAKAYQRRHPTYTYKYYKGLGTSTAKEAKAYFSKLDQYRFNMSGDPLPLKRAYGDDTSFRKELSARPPQQTDGKTYADFVNGPYATYVRADNVRKIPNIFDGLKVVQRKILYTFIKKNYKKEQKVAQMAGIIAKETQYHSGEDNISKAIINMAQEFVGSNNLPLLKANGQFGTRHCGGSDAAAPRYINTELHDYVKYIFPESDLPVLSYTPVDGQVVEPDEFVPIIPWVFVNGICGLGTGWVSDIPQHNPLKLIALTRYMIRQQRALTDINAWQDESIWTKDHSGYYKREDGKLYSHGNYKIQGDTLTISELPVGVWTEKIEHQLKNPKSKLEFSKVEESHTDTTIQFVIKGVKDMQKMIGALKLKKLVRENYVVFQDGSIVNKAFPHIMNTFIGKRRWLYDRRKEYHLKQLGLKQREMHDKMKFIEACIAGNIPLTTASNLDLIAACMEHGVNEKYLDINLRDLTKDKVDKLKKSIAIARRDFDKLKNTIPEDIWEKELNELERLLNPKSKKRSYIDLSV
jgi:DNA topoisomerase-2